MVNISWPRIGHFGKIKRWKLKIQCQKKTFLKKGGISAHSQNWLDPRKRPIKATMSPVFQWTKIWFRRSGEKVRFIFWSIFIKYLIFIHPSKVEPSRLFQSPLYGRVTKKYDIYRNNNKKTGYFGNFETVGQKKIFMK